MIKKTPSGWRVDIQPGGRGSKRYRKTFKTRVEARQWENWITAKVTETPTWSPKRRDTRSLRELIQLWQLLHGQNLRSDQYRTMMKVCERLRNPTVDRFTSTLFTQYRSDRIQEGVSLNTINREHAYLRAMFNELKRLGHWINDNPLSTVRQFAVSETELVYLTQPQISLLLEELHLGRNKDVYKITLLALATGARWSEAETLRSELLSIDPPIVTYVDTKGKRNRSIPISRELAILLKTKQYGRLFKGSYAAFRNAIKRSDIELPNGQMTHVLRHTFASHFMINGGNILTLQRILGHSSLNMTMRYAHLAPDHLREAVSFNPTAAYKYSEE